MKPLRMYCGSLIFKYVFDNSVGNQHEIRSSIVTYDNWNSHHGRRGMIERTLGTS